LIFQNAKNYSKSFRFDVSICLIALQYQLASIQRYLSNPVAHEYTYATRYGCIELHHLENQWVYQKGQAEISVCDRFCSGLNWITKLHNAGILCKDLQSQPYFIPRISSHRFWSFRLLLCQSNVQPKSIFRIVLKTTHPKNKEFQNTI
jgi:hypothetical protein